MLQPSMPPVSASLVRVIAQSRLLGQRCVPGVLGVTVTVYKHVDEPHAHVIVVGVGEAASDLDVHEVRHDLYCDKPTTFGARLDAPARPASSPDLGLVPSFITCSFSTTH